MSEQFELAEPRAGSLIEALRAVGYNLETAIADLIDNSITASAANVWLTFTWAGTGSTIAIVDDGKGMSEAELSDAMRPGNRSPLETRSESDLGRFGLGLKTASFSQCRRLTVASKKAALVSVRRWDLDYVGRTGEWRLLKDADPEAEALLAPAKSGTAVLWQALDRVVGTVAPGDRRAQDRFLGSVSTAKRHLEMVFHQYLEGSRPRLRIWINGRDEAHRLKPWDPFLESHPATIAISDEERLVCGDAIVSVKGFVLPHKDRLTDEQFGLAAGPRGWHAQQGFYVYRNRRLLVSGGWLGLDRLASEEHYKLARLQLEIPNSVDADWAIDVKKSRARPPNNLRQRLTELAGAVRARAREVYVHRGRASVGAGGEPLRRAWSSVIRAGHLTYKIDRENPLVRGVLGRATDPEHRRATEAMLRLLEATVPIQQIWLDTAEHNEGHAAPFEGEAPSHVREVMVAMFRALLIDRVPPHLARQRIASMTPFNEYPELLGTLTESEE